MPLEEKNDCFPANEIELFVLDESFAFWLKLLWKQRLIDRQRTSNEKRKKKIFIEGLAVHFQFFYFGKNEKNEWIMIKNTAILR